MKRTSGIIALGLASVATVALAHTGAKGVVLERMNGMTAMRDIMRDLAPIMQGAATYDAISVSEAGFVIASHAGDTMRTLFPKDSLEGVTYATPTIWTEWDEFASLSEELRVYAEALREAAPNGLEPVAADMSGMNNSPMVMTPNPETDRVQDIASLMGFATPNPAATGPALTLVSPGGMQPQLVGTGARNIFEQISGTCSACHARFRKGRS